MVVAVSPRAGSAVGGGPTPFLASEETAGAGPVITGEREKMGGESSVGVFGSTITPVGLIPANTGVRVLRLVVLVSGGAWVMTGGEDVSSLVVAGGGGGCYAELANSFHQK